MSAATRWVLYGFMILMLAAVILIVFLAVTVGSMRTSRITTSSEELNRRFAGRRRLDGPIVTLTTLPSRLAEIEEVIKSWLRQSFPPKQIVLNIPHVLKRTGEAYVLPDWLKKMTAVTVRRCDDEGPGTKYLSTFRKASPHDLILVTDDDMVAPRDMIARLMDTHRQFPDAAVAAMGAVIVDDATSKFRKFFSRRSYHLAYDLENTFFGLDEIRVVEPGDTVDVDVLLGMFGYMFRKNLLPDGALDLADKPKEAFFVDDMVMAFELERAGVRKIVCGNAVSTVPRNPWAAMDEFFGGSGALSATVNRFRANDKAVIAWYREQLRSGSGGGT